MGLVIQNADIFLAVGDVRIELKGIDTANIEDSTSFDLIYPDSNKLQDGIVQVSGASLSDKVTLTATVLEKDVSDTLKDIFIELEEGDKPPVKLLIFEKNKQRTKMVLNGCIPTSKTRQLLIDEDAKSKYTIGFVGKLISQNEYNLEEVR